MNTTSEPCRSTRLRAAAGLAGVLVLAACASAPPAPTASLQDARQAIATAEQAQAGQYAPAELGHARANLQSADAALRDNQMVAAQRLARESRVDAELATAKTADVKANAVNADMQRSTAILINEIQRSAGDSQ